MKQAQQTAILAQLMQLAITQQSTGWVSDGSMSKTVIGTLCGVSTGKRVSIRWRMSDADALLIYEDIDSFMQGAKYKTGVSINLRLRGRHDALEEVR